MAQFYRPTSAPNLQHAKIFKEWSNVGKKDQFGRVEEKLPDGGNPSGVYSAWFYLPKDYQVTSSTWTNLFQFKEEGYIGGVKHQDPSWWLNMSKASTWGQGGSEPVIFANHWQNDWGYKPNSVKAPLGRWFEIKAALYENDRIDWYLDGVKFDTSKDSTWDVGRFYDQSNGWIFGVGHYDGYGKVWVDDAKVTTLGDVGTPTPTPTPIPVPGSNVINGDASANRITGTSGPDKIDARDGNDMLWGKDGNDVLTGGPGSDTFVFDTRPNATSNIDVITDFNPQDDTIHLENSVFTSFRYTGRIGDTNFNDRAPDDNNDYVWYDRGTGKVYYDPDGNGSAASAVIVVLQNKPLLTEADFLII